MEINFTKIKPSIKKYIKEYYDIKASNTKNIKLEFFDKLRKGEYVNTLISALKEYTNLILIDYQLKSMNVKDITTKNVINLLNSNSSTDINCVNIKEKKLIGKGYYGRVYKIDSKKVVKIINIDNSFSYNNPDNLKKKLLSEYNIAKKAGDIGVGPKVYDHFICKSDSGNYHIIYMENIEKSTTLSKWSDNDKNDKYKADLLKKIKSKLQKLHDNNIVHRDLHANNILVVKKNNKFDVIIIDYGLAQTKDNTVIIEKENDFKDLKYLINTNINLYNFVVDKLLQNNELKLYI